MEQAGKSVTQEPQPVHAHRKQLRKLNAAKVFREYQGRVYDIENEAWHIVDGSTVFTSLPVYDSAVVIADRKEIARVAQLEEAVGVMLSPQAGKWVSDLVTGEMDPKENPLRPTRYKEGLGKKGKTLMSH